MPRAAADRGSHQSCCPNEVMGYASSVTRLAGLLNQQLHDEPVIEAGGEKGDRSRSVLLVLLHNLIGPSQQDGGGQECHMNEYFPFQMLRILIGYVHKSL